MSDKIKKLSQAIRLGATLHPETKGFYRTDSNGNVCGTCAVTAAAIALNVMPTIKPFTCNGGEIIDCVAERLSLERQIVSEVSARHFYNHVTREQIADWLETQGL